MTRPSPIAGLIGFLVLLVLTALAYYSLRIEPAQLRLNTYDVALDGAPDLKGLKIAVISDLHGGAPFIDHAKIDRVVTTTNAVKPDLILLTGDLNSHIAGSQDGRIEEIVPQLGHLSAPLGVYAVLGNHDRWEGAERVQRILESAHIPVLENAQRRITTPRGSLYLVGIGDFVTHAARPGRALRGVPATADALCFTHSPDIFPVLRPTCALTIAGHTHGGQVKLPLLGRPLVPSRYGQRYAAGIVREKGKTLFISTGIGTSIIPVRLGVPPEIALLQIR